jgi:arginyl-tRNA synthetase
MTTKNIFADVLVRVRDAARGVLPAGVDQSRVTVEPPRDPGHGDVATNAAMVLAKDAGKTPRELAEAIAGKLRADSAVEKVDVGGPGFINITLKPVAWIDALRGAVHAGAQYGASDLGAATPVNVEYSANPTGPMHVGHCRGAVFGDALANLLAFTGYKVTREFYVNDAGALVMAAVRADLAALDIEHDVFSSARSLVDGKTDLVDATIAWLRQRGYVYEGRLPPPKGAPVEDWQDREQTLFRSTEFGDDVDRALQKSDGSYTDFASDIAYHRSKIERGFRALIDVWGADRAGSIKRVQAAVAALSDRNAELDVKVVQVVKLLRSGQPVTMSKRAGEFVTLRDLVDEVGCDAVRFIMLFRKNDAVLEFDLAKAVEQSRDNPVFHVQYGHARGHSVFRNARVAFPDLPDDIAGLADGAALERLSDPAELALMRQIALYPRVVEAAAAAHEPHRIAFYLFDLASEFHALWTLGNTASYLRFIIQNDRQMTVARLVLVQGVVTVLASGLGLLGVGAPSEMR